MEVEGTTLEVAAATAVEAVAGTAEGAEGAKDWEEGVGKARGVGTVQGVGVETVQEVEIEQGVGVGTEQGVGTGQEVGEEKAEVRVGVAAKGPQPLHKHQILSMPVCKCHKCVPLKMGPFL